jgi:CRP-like cAMP-binding protein
MDHLANVNNQLLAALPPADFALLAPHFQTVTLEQDAVLMHSGDRIEHVYFLHSGTVSLMVDMPSGQTVACAVVGREGALGALSVLGPSRSTTTAVIRSPGSASQISASRFHAAIGHSRAIRQIVEIHARAMLAQIQQIAACNALHPVEDRTARWLLHIHDRVDGDVLPLTQEALAQLLGVRRTTVTQTVQKLRASGAVRYDRRAMIEVVDRPRLQQGACECYDIMCRQTERILPRHTTTPSVRETSRAGLLADDPLPKPRLR